MSAEDRWIAAADRDSYARVIARMVASGDDMTLPAAQRLVARFIALDLLAKNGVQS